MISSKEQQMEFLIAESVSTVGNKNQKSLLCDAFSMRPFTETIAFSLLPMTSLIQITKTDWIIPTYRNLKKDFEEKLVRNEFRYLMSTSLEKMEKNIGI